MKKFRIKTLKRLDNISTYSYSYYEAPDGTILYALADDGRDWLMEWYVVNEDGSLAFIGYTEESDLEYEWV